MKFKRICRKIRRERSRAATTSKRSDFMRTMSAASIAISVPVQSAIPTSAVARAGESLMPSPTYRKGKRSDFDKSAGRERAAHHCDAMTLPLELLDQCLLPIRTHRSVNVFICNSHFTRDSSRSRLLISCR